MPEVTSDSDYLSYLKILTGKCSLLTLLSLHRVAAAARRARLSAEHSVARGEWKGKWWDDMTTRCLHSPLRLSLSHLVSHPIPGHFPSYVLRLRSVVTLRGAARGESKTGSEPRRFYGVNDCWPKERCGKRRSGVPHHGFRLLLSLTTHLASAAVRPVAMMRRDGTRSVAASGLPAALRKW